MRTLPRDIEIKQHAYIKQYARLLALYFDVNPKPNEDAITLLERSVDAACRYRVSHL